MCLIAGSEKVGCREREGEIMNRYLVLKLQGVMQAWGGHTYEDLRHTELIPTRSGILGLLAGSLGIDRKNVGQQKALAASVLMAVRTDTPSKRITDFHTVMGARKVDGKPNKNPVVSRREYLCDAHFTVLLQEKANDTAFTVDNLAEAVQNPIYTTFLGRRSCAITRPIYEEILESVDFANAFSLVEPYGGTIYSDVALTDQDSQMTLRDIPLYARKRQFASRKLYVHNPTVIGDNNDVFE